MNKLNFNLFCSRLPFRVPGIRGVGMLGAFLGFSLHTHAVAFRLPNQDPEGIARGNAFAATADNPSAIYYNPAGITQLTGQSLDVGLYLVSAGDTFEGKSGSTAKTKAFFQAVPQVYYVNSLKDLPITLGLGVYVPYGLSLDWGANPPFRNVADHGSLLYVTVNPVIAWQVTRTVSIAAGPTFNYSKAELTQGLGLTPGDVFHFRGDDSDVGFNAGVRWQPIEELSFGLNYRYETHMNYHGHADATGFTTTSATAALQFPQFAVAGISYRPTTNWNFEVDIDWTDWDNVNQIDFQNTPIGSFPFLQNYKSSFMYEFGVTRQLCHGYSVMAGYIYSENSIPNQNFNPIIPDSDLHLFSVGLAHRGQRWDWALSYTFAVNPGSEVSGSSFGPTVDGTYRTINQAINASVTWKF